MLGVVNNNRLLRSSRHEDLDSIIVIAVGALVERALDAYDRILPAEEGQGRRNARYVPYWVGSE